VVPAGVPAVAGQMVQGQLVPPPPGAMQMQLPQGAMAIPAGAVIQGMPNLPPGSLHMVAGGPHPGTPMAMAAAAAAAAAAGASGGMAMGVPPGVMLAAPQGMTPGAVAAAAAAMGMGGMAPPPPGMMAPPGVVPMAAMPRPPMAVAAGPPGAQQMRG
jgi:hypothetical protein